MNNIYDDQNFFDAYGQMPRSREGLSAAGEWQQFRRFFPDLSQKKVLDLGCGYGWHCKYAQEKGAASVLGIDASQRMIGEAKRQNAGPGIRYEVCDLEAYEYPPEEYDLVISNLVLHYIRDLDGIYRKVYETLKPGGTFLFNIEHPVFTGSVKQEWVLDENGKPKHWPVDQYFYPGERVTDFLGQEVKKQHHTLTQIVMGLIGAGFAIEALEEAMPPEKMRSLPGMADEMRRPMMLLLSAHKPA